MLEAEDKDMTPMDAINYGLTGKVSVSTSELKRRMRPTFWEYFDDWGRRESSSKRQRALAVRKIAGLMGRNDDWEDIDSAYWLRLMRKLEDMGYSVNYRWNIGTR